MTELFRALAREVGGHDWQVATPPAARPRSEEPVNAKAREPVLGHRVFRDALVREQRRAERFGTPFAVLLVDRSDRASDSDVWVAVLRAVAAVKRDVDAVAGSKRAPCWRAPAGGLRKGSGQADAATPPRGRRRLGDDAYPPCRLRLYGHGIEPCSTAPTSPQWTCCSMLRAAAVHPWRDGAKRTLDIVGSLGLLALFAPVSLAIVAVVKWTSPAR